MRTDLTGEEMLPPDFVALNSYRCVATLAGVSPMLENLEDSDGRTLL